MAPARSQQEADKARSLPRGATTAEKAQAAMEVAPAEGEEEDLCHSSHQGLPERIWDK